MNVLARPILIIGFGSIGQRHLRNLKQLGFTNFVLYRSGKSTLPLTEIGNIPIENTLKKALAHKPFATIIANPTSLHVPVALAAARAGSHVFLEKPVSNTLDSVEELREVANKNNLTVQIGFQFRFHPDFLKIKKLIASKKMGNVVTVHAHWGEYLPDWHPWEDYRKSYSAKKELGGGVLLTLCHPFDYLRFLLGEIHAVCAITSKQGLLNIHVETCADVLLNFKSGVTGTVHLNYLERPPEHFLHIVTEKGVIHWSNVQGLKYSVLGKKWIPTSTAKTFERNTLFLQEMKHFLSCIMSSKQPVCTLDDGVQTMKIILAAKQSVIEKRLIEIL